MTATTQQEVDGWIRELADFVARIHPDNPERDDYFDVANRKGSEFIGLDVHVHAGRFIDLGNYPSEQAHARNYCSWRLIPQREPIPYGIQPDGPIPREVGKPNPAKGA